MANITDFINRPKSMIIAPAGHGKTHMITDCLISIQHSSRCLILTHTHAGIASLREKIKKRDINPEKYTLDTISSFALKYTNAFHINRESFPDAENSHQYFNFAIATATNLVLAKPIQKVLKTTFSHLIVDEYQDCSKEQHKLIQNISLTLPTHILGDPLQGIFSFNNELVNLYSPDEMGEFLQNKQELSTPWRWNNAGSPSLGTALLDIRTKLISNQPINLDDYKDSINTIIEKPEDFYKIRNSNAKTAIWNEVNNSENNSLLLIHPASTNILPRIKLNQQFNNRFKLIESIDDKNFYSYCKEFDSKSGEDLINSILKFSKELFLKTAINNWFKESGKLKDKRSPDDKVISNSIQTVIDQILKQKTYRGIATLIYKIFKLPNNKCDRPDFCNDIYQALNHADIEDISAYESIKKNRDILRRQGRKVIGKCIGTTLLTKGLEFDTVIILDAQKFEDPKHLYVALTRACKRLVIITDKTILEF